MNRLQQHLGASQPEEGDDLRLETLVLTVGPDLARTWLESSRGGRPVCPAAVARYARCMVLGRWALNGAALIFDRHGTLLDGQRRLAAVVQAGVGVRMLVVRGVEPWVAATLDAGSPRALTDLLAAQGEPRPRLLGATLRLLSRHLDQEALERSTHPSSLELMSLLQLFPGLRASLSLVCAQGWWRWAPLPALAVAHFLLCDESGECDRVTELLLQLQEGADLVADHPLLELRRRIFERRSPSSLSTLEAILAALQARLDLESPRPSSG